jgi:C1A family cysteine protease
MFSFTNRRQQNNRLALLASQILLAQHKKRVVSSFLFNRNRNQAMKKYELLQTSFPNSFKLNHKPSASKPHIDKHIGTISKPISAAVTTFPSSYSLASKYPLPILNQGPIGSCVANCFCSIMSSIYGGTYSRLYTYFNARVGTGNSPVQDTGLDILQAKPYLVSFGLVPETNWPYNVTQFSVIPPYANTYKVADTTTKINMDPLAQTANAIQTAITSGKFVMVGITIYSSFMTQQVATNGLVPMPNTRIEAIKGGHCVHICGWCNVNGQPYFIIRNSWGTNWGNNGSTTPPSPFTFRNNGSNGGFCYIPFNYILSNQLAFELFAVY